MEAGRIGRLLAAAGDGWDLAADDLLLVDPGREDESRPQLGTAGPASDIGLAEFVSANLPTPGAGRKELEYMKPLIRRAFLEQHGLRYDPALRLGEDYALYSVRVGPWGSVTARVRMRLRGATKPRVAQPSPRGRRVARARPCRFETACVSGPRAGRGAAA